MKYKFILQSIFSVLGALIISIPTFAAVPSDSVLNFFAENNIFYYNPVGVVTGGSQIICATTEEGQGSNTLYNGDPILSESDLEKIEKFKDIYQEAAGSDFPWQVLATIHYMENSLADHNVNPKVGGGMFGITRNGSSGYYHKEGTLTREEMLEQAKDAAGIIKNIINHSNLDLSNPDDVKTLFFHYNSGMYVDVENDPKLDWFRGHKMYGDDAAAARGEGSNYVMNMADAARDPFSSEKDDSWLGQGDKWWSNHPGAFLIYGAIGGTGMCEGLSSGGITSIEAVKSHMQEYISRVKQNCAQYINWSACNVSGQLEPGANCVTYVKYFLKNFTTLGDVGSTGDGWLVAKNLASRYNLELGDTPRVYAVFSETNSSGMGHTGVVLGIDVENNKIYIGQQALKFTLDYGMEVRHIEYDLDEWNKTKRDYVYLDPVLKL